MDRRHFVAWFGGLLGYKATETTAIAASTPTSIKRGFACFYINIGMLPSFKAEAFIDRMKDQFRKYKGMDDWEVIWIPVRPPQETKIEFFAVDGKPINAVTESKAFKQLVTEGTPFVAPDKKQITESILLYLGAPVCVVEMDQQQLGFVYDETKELFDKVGKAKGLHALNMGGMGAEVFKNIALAKASIMLGMIRSKYKNVEGIVMMNGADLIDEGRESLIYWTEQLNNI